MGLVAGADDLRVAAEREDVVAHHVVAAVVLVESAVGRAVDEVVLQDDAGAPLVGVEAPALVVPRDVVDHVVPHHRPGREPERVDRPHVRQQPLADVVDAVELDAVVAADARRIAPDPADGDAGVVEVGDLVVRDGVAEAVHHQHAHAAVEQAAEVVEAIVGDDRLAGAQRLGVDGPVDLDPPRADPGQLVPHQADPAAAVAQVDRVAGEVLQRAILDRDVPRPGGDHRARDLARRLGVHRLARAGLPGRIGEGQAAQRDMLDESARRPGPRGTRRGSRAGGHQLRAIAATPPRAAGNAACRPTDSRRTGPASGPRTRSSGRSGRGGADARR